MSGYQRQNRGGGNRQQEYPEPDIGALVFFDPRPRNAKAPQMSGIITFNEDFTFRRGDKLQIACWDRRKQAKNGADIFSGECKEDDGGRRDDNRRRDHDKDRDRRGSGDYARAKAGRDDDRPRAERDDPRDYDRGRHDDEPEYDRDGQPVR
jgi:hypothetical protein